MTEEFKELVGLHHILLLTNIVLFVLIAFISWDLLWWWAIGDWDPAARVFFALLIVIVNGVTSGAFFDWKKAKDK